MTSARPHSLLTTLLSGLRVAVLLVAGSSQAQDYPTANYESLFASFSISCTDEGAASCASQQRLCLVNTTTTTTPTARGEEFCGPCLVGFIEVPEAFVEALEAALTTKEDINSVLAQDVSDGSDMAMVCTDIQQITFATYALYFEPDLLDEGDPAERQQRLQDAATFISNFNRDNFNASFDLGINEYASATEEEAQPLTGYVRPDDSTTTDTQQVFVPDEDAPFPPSINWILRGAVTRVKNQGLCGSCWAVATSGALEGAVAIASNYTFQESLSQQQLVSCDKDHKGCDGGFPARAFDYADDQGMAALVDYPYTDGKTGETTKECNLKGKPVAVESGEGYKVNWYGEVGDDSYSIRVDRLKYALARGPVSISMRANCNRIMFYRRGVITNDGDCACTPQNDSCHDHAVLAVGYNDLAPVPYWIIKNSWGQFWGEGGYFRVAQLNPDGVEDSFGLFGVLAEGLIPLDAKVAPADKTFDQNARYPTWFKILIACIICLGVCLVIMLGLYIKEKCFSDQVETEKVMTDQS